MTRDAQFVHIPVASRVSYNSIGGSTKNVSYNAIASTSAGIHLGVARHTYTKHITLDI